MALELSSVCTKIYGVRRLLEDANVVLDCEVNVHRVTDVNWWTNGARARGELGMARLSTSHVNRGRFQALAYIHCLQFFCWLALSVDGREMIGCGFVLPTREIVMLHRLLSTRFTTIDKLCQW